ncbi:MAG: hypothetical protein JNK67_18475 [Alphaproteobacteria bacterium]|nr:hypothetical protein [Alphaproteobacteria bacterium]
MRRAVLGALLVAASAVAASAQDVPIEPGGAWKLVGGVPAPWVTGPGGASVPKGMVGKTLAFAIGRVAGPHPLGCGGAHYEFAMMPGEGLFQGGLPAPVDASARKAGVATLPALSLQVSCDKGVFDYHLAGPGRLVTALDNVVWTLQATKGAASAAPEAVVARLLVDHFTHDMGFTVESAARKRGWFTAGLNRRIAAYFAAPFPDDEPPPINGDPITNSQDYPTRFTIARAAVRGREATVRVQFSDEGRTRPTDFVLRRGDAGWRIDDLVYADATRFSASLEPPKR